MVPSRLPYGRRRQRPTLGSSRVSMLRPSRTNAYVQVRNSRALGIGVPFRRRNRRPRIMTRGFHFRRGVPDDWLKRDRLAKLALRNASSTASGCRAITVSSTRAGPSGRVRTLLPVLRVAGWNPNFAAKAVSAAPASLKILAFQPPSSPDHSSAICSNSRPSPSSTAFRPV